MRRLAGRIDGFCARLTPGLIAVAIVLVAVLAAASAERAMEIIDAAPGHALLGSGDPPDIVD
jgi:hypothetical protein